MNVIFFDVETTGIDRSHDEIIELSATLVSGEAERTVTERFMPARDIHPDARAVHGISIQDLKGCPSFQSRSHYWHGVFSRADVIGGYNVSFDMDMMLSAFRREGVMQDPFEGKPIVDPYEIWKQLEPRTLEGAVKRFCGREMDNSHAAGADVEATMEVLAAMKDHYAIKESWHGLAEIGFPDRKNWIGGSNHIQYVDGVPTVTFGKHAGTPLKRLDIGYAEWVMKSNFPPHVKRIMAVAYESPSELIEDRIAEMYPRRMAA